MAESDTEIPLRVEHGVQGKGRADNGHPDQTETAATEESESAEIKTEPLPEIDSVATDPADPDADGHSPNCCFRRAWNRLSGTSTAQPGGPTPPVKWIGFRLYLHQNWSHLSAPWRQDVQRTRIMLLGDLLRLNPNQDRKRERVLLYALLEDASRASRARVNFRKWWFGTEIERAWRNLHEVGQRLVEILPNEDVAARANFAAERGRRYLRDGDKRLQHLETLRVQAGATPEQLRPAIVEVMRATQAASDRTNQEARYFRNRLLIASVVSLLFAVILVIVQWRLGDNARLLYPPADWHGPAWAFLITVMIFGSVGALFTTIPAMAKIPSDFSAFNLPYQQAMLKIVFGQLVAVIGIAILSFDTQHSVVPKTWPALLLVAVVFGAAQQAVTRYVDQRANSILEAIAPASTRDTA